MIALILIIHFTTKPIKKLRSEIEGLDLNKPFDLSKMGFNELDNIIESLCKISKTQSKMLFNINDALKDLNFSIGVYYFDKIKSKYVCSASMDIFLNTNHGGFNFILDKDTLEKDLNFLKMKPYQFESDVYLYNDLYIKINETKENDVIKGVVYDCTDQIVNLKRLIKEAKFDNLTGLLKRKQFKKLCKERQDKYKRSCYVMVDLDKFKNINDTYGHEFGDKVLKSFAASLKYIANDDILISRRSGDEFLIFFGGYTKKAVSDFLIKKENAIKKIFYDNITNKDIELSYSCGIAEYPEDSESIEELLAFAHIAMYKTKNGELLYFNKNMIDEVLKDKATIEEMNDIFDNERVTFTFQPIIERKTGNIFAYEALMRINGNYILNPTDLISVASVNNRLYDLERLTFKKCIDAFKDDIKNYHIFINSIPSIFLKQEEFNEIFKPIIEYKKNVVIEFKEHEIFNERIISNKLQLMEEGKIQAAIADFASYYSNSTLENVKANYLKIDRGIISKCDSNKTKQSIISDIIRMCREKDIKVIAQGIETKEEFNYLINLDIDYMQGYFIGLPKEKITDINISIKQLLNTKKD